MSIIQQLSLIADDSLVKHYDLTDGELDFIINYDI